MAGGIAEKMSKEIDKTKCKNHTQRNHNKVNSPISTITINLEFGYACYVSSAIAAVILEK